MTLSQYCGGLEIERSRFNLVGEVGFDDLLDRLPDAQRIEILHVGEAVEEEDAVDELVGVPHLLDGFLAPLLGEVLEAPIVQQAIVQPVLVDGRQLASQAAVHVFENLGVATHR